MKELQREVKKSKKKRGVNENHSSIFPYGKNSNDKYKPVLTLKEEGKDGEKDKVK